MTPPPRLDCPRRDDLPPTLSARADLPFWQSVPAAALVETVTGAPPAQATRVRTARSAAELRVLFDCDDTRPWATLTRRDGPLWNEEVVEVFLDPFGDGQIYFELEVNPLNTVCDLVLRRVATGWRKDFSWHAEGLRTVTRNRPGGWTAELSVPFAALGPEVGVNGETWRVNFLRIDRLAGAEAELSAWSPTGARNFHRWERFGELKMTNDE